ncbi:MAG: phospholipase/carboxylesterase [Acetobacteraceae bacterium]|nr:phospholipase/carboxylesterase [Acetobacteraceae bacterium]
MEQGSQGKGKPMAEDLTRLFDLMDTLGRIARMMHPRRLDALAVLLGDRDDALRQTIGHGSSEQVRAAATLALQACTGLRASLDADNPILEALRAMRQYSRAQEALTALADILPEVGRYLLEPAYRDDPTLLQRLAAPPHPDSGVFHVGHQTNERGGYSVFVPPWYDATQPVPLIMALHGGSGHGRLFLWNWVPEARSRGMIVVSATATGRTWSLMEPEIDSQNLDAILGKVADRWNIDRNLTLLTGMSDGGTFTLLSGLAAESRFTHLAPAAASFHPLMLAVTDPERIAGLPIHLTHGAQDWMFPVDMARTAHRTLAAAGAAITYRELADLSHAYPRDGQGEVLDWFTGEAHITGDG